MCIALLCDLKAAQMKVQRRLIQELMLLELELDHNTVDVMKNISCSKGEGGLDHRTVIRWSKKFRTSYKNLEDQETSARPKIANSETVL